MFFQEVKYYLIFLSFSAIKPAYLENKYALSIEEIREPPASLTGKLRELGPGFILSAAVVGSGELIATTTLGAKAGFVTFWVILVSCLVKVTLQIEFGKHAIYSGETVMAAFNKLPGPRFGRANWSIWVWLFKSRSLGYALRRRIVVFAFREPPNLPGFLGAAFARSRAC